MRNIDLKSNHRDCSAGHKKRHSIKFHHNNKSNYMYMYMYLSSTISELH